MGISVIAILTTTLTKMINARYANERFFLAVRHGPPGKGESGLSRCPNFRHGILLF
jgi:hypothetical protein